MQIILPHFVNYTVCRSAITLSCHTPDYRVYLDCKNITACTQEQNNSGVQKFDKQRKIKKIFKTLLCTKNMLLLKQKERLTKYV